MKVKLAWPSPAMCVAVLALFVALGGTSIAAVGYAKRAGKARKAEKVDGKSAVSASSTLRRAAGKLVATTRSGPDRGQIPAKFLASNNRSFGSAFEVVDNATLAPAVFGGAEGVGTFEANCADQSPKPGVEDPMSTIQFVNRSGGLLNVTRRKGTDPAAIEILSNGAVAPFTLVGSNTFEFQIQRAGLSLLINGTVRQDGKGQPAASCLVYGTVVRVDE